MCEAEGEEEAAAIGDVDDGDGDREICEPEPEMEGVREWREEGVADVDVALGCETLQGPMEADER